MTQFPKTPIMAVTHPIPYYYYLTLAKEQPFFFHTSINIWVAASAEAVTTILSHEACRVRPAAEPVPAALVGSAAGRIFGALVRMNDGQSHCPMKQAVSATLDSISPNSAFERSQRWAKQLISEIQPDQILDFAFRLPVYVVADLLGVPSEHLPEVAGWMADFVYCLSPISTAEQIEQGKQAAKQLLALFQRLLAAEGSGLMHRLKQALAEQGIDNMDIVAANAIGFISQSYEATAGLIVNALLVINKFPAYSPTIASDLDLLGRFVTEAARHSPPVQNTRRYAAADVVIMGETVKAGDAILVVLAAANHDARVNPKSEMFDPYRRSWTSFAFGLGVHGCPGQALALSITQAAVQQLILADFPIHALNERPDYRPSVNTRIPLLTLRS